MKHHIIFKLNQLGKQQENFIERVTEAFANITSIEGIYGYTVHKNIVERDNRYDVMIIIDMEPSALEAYDHCQIHTDWKNNFTQYMEHKVIFDYM